MSHFPLIVCVDDPARLDQVLEPFDENLNVEPYRAYEEGSPADYWAVPDLREKHGLEPDDMKLTWQQVADAYNARYRGENQLLVDFNGRAFTLSTYNPQSKWDWYAIGGRWIGFFKVRDASLTDERLMQGQPGAFNAPNVDPLRCDGGPKCLLDLEGMRDEAAERAGTKYDWFARVAAQHPPARGWSHFVECTKIEPDYTIDRAREEYHAQPLVAALEKLPGFRFFNRCQVDHFAWSREEYVANERAAAVPGFALLTLDGEWLEPGRMGWFGMSSDTAGTRDAYQARANGYIDALPDEIYLIAVDCHI